MVKKTVVKAAPKKKAAKAKQATPRGKAVATAEVTKLRKQVAQLQSKLDKVSLERNFLERATSDLNFHNNAHDGVVYTNSDNQITYANPYFMSMMGIAGDKEILEKTFPTYMWNSAQEAERLFQDIKKDGFVREREMALYNKEGQAVFAMCSGVASRDDEGNVIGTEIMFCNITSKRKFQAELLEQNALFDAVLQSTPDPILVLSADLRLTRANQAAMEIFGAEEGAQKGLAELLTRKDLSQETTEKILARFTGERPFDFEVAVGDQHFDWHAAPLKSLLKGWVCVLHNITVRKLTQEMLQHHAFHDALTQVPNRSYFVDHLQRANLLTRNEVGYRYAVLFVDLDDLKSFNDNFGHHVGDELLYSFARRIEASIRPGDVVARLGGDEFAVFLDHVDQAADATQVATRVREAVSKPYHLGSHPEDVRTTASIGIALSDPKTDAEALLRNADKAMYEVKQNGGDNFGLFEPDHAAA